MRCMNTVGHYVPVGDHGLVRTESPQGSGIPHGALRLYGPGFTTVNEPPRVRSSDVVILYRKVQRSVGSINILGLDGPLWQSHTVGVSHTIGFGRFSQVYQYY